MDKQEEMKEEDPIVNKAEEELVQQQQQMKQQPPVALDLKNYIQPAVQIWQQSQPLIQQFQ